MAFDSVKRLMPRRSEFWEALMATSSIEKCANCGKPIGKLETPHVLKDEIICADCHSRLSEFNGPKPSSVRRRMTRAIALVAGIVIAVVAVFLVGAWTGLHMVRRPSNQSALSRGMISLAPASGKGTIYGNTWITRNNGSSDIQRGMLVELVSIDAPRGKVSARLEQAARDFAKSADDLLQKAAQKRKDNSRFRRDNNLPEIPLSEYDPGHLEEVHGRQSEAKAQRARAAAQGLPQRINARDAVLLLAATAETDESSPNEHAYSELIVKSPISDVRTDVDGKFQIDNIPPGDYCVHAWLSTKTTLVMWLVPVHVDPLGVVRIDLFKICNNRILDVLPSGYAIAAPAAGYFDVALKAGHAADEHCSAGAEKGTFLYMTKTRRRC
jgi:DNA-directed RNA polymerase subunit RPC12/RpoP